MDAYMVLKYVHILSATLLFGTGLGTAFHGWMTHRGNAEVAAAVGRNVVLADWVFTAPAVVVQPVTGIALAHLAGFPLSSSWLVVSIGLYILIGACWLPVVGLQIRMHRLAREAAANGSPLPPQFHGDARLWFLLGWPAFLGVLAITWLMISKPSLW